MTQSVKSTQELGRLSEVEHARLKLAIAEQKMAEMRVRHQMELVIAVRGIEHPVTIDVETGQITNQ